MTSTPPTTKPPRARTRPTTASTSNGADRQIKIGEAARIIGVEAYVLRFWETQFPFLRPRHSHSKHRYYDEKSLDSLRLIRRLLHSEGYTIAGAKKHIREGGLDRLRSEVIETKPAEP
ncbi:MAG: MerR family transcriptional regulator, partial [Deltaproteobacteria bacterium]|nr:MerR family transcriptional regulator [Deltaproteobacteria bacterium]